MTSGLDDGRSFGHYRIVSKIGAGGMGEVYRALDARLNREVAIKVLPADLTNDEDRLRRFKQEAEATSALNHPNILTVYDIGEHDGSPFIVSELLEGEELRDRLDEGPIPLRKVTDYAQQIVSGLTAAHEKGIVHRDLKPENLFITKDDRVKILDFGLAKLSAPGADATGSEDHTRKALTNPGVVMGTVGYMSPEQVRGQKTDHRSDIFSFGLILYEMITGRRAFQEESMAETMSAIVKEEPPEMTESNPNISPSLERIVRRCLEKKPERRFQSTADLGFALESSGATTTLSGSGRAEVMSEPEPAAASKGGGLLRSAGWIVAGIAVLAALSFVYFSRPTADTRPISLSIATPLDTEIPFESLETAVVSPDGKKIAITGGTADGKRQLWIRSLDSFEVKAIPQTENATNPFWSPDSRFIGFRAGGKLKKVEAAGGPVTVLTEARAMPGGTWNRSGTIVFAPDFGSVLYSIPDTGGDPVPLTTLDGSQQEDSHMWPTFLPDGNHFLFLARSTRNKKNQICLGSLDSKEVKRIMTANSIVGYVEPGWLVFLSEGRLMTQAFDAKSIALSGEPLNVAEKVGYIGDWARGAASVSTNGVLLFQTSEIRNIQFEWIDRAGVPIGPIGPPGDYSSSWISPNDKLVALSRLDAQSGSTDIWTLDLVRGVMSRLTSDPNGDWKPLWSADGSRIAWGSDRKTGLYDIYQMAADGSGSEELLLEGASDKFPTAWSKDGRLILYNSSDTRTKGDILVLPLFGDRRPFPLLNTDFSEQNAALSPSGDYVAYISDESGDDDVYVQKFTADGKLGGGKQRISTKGGKGPVFSRNGQELFYVTDDGTMMAVAIKTAGGVSTFGEPKAIIKKPELLSGFEVTSDGQRFLIGKKVGDSKPTINVILNWTAGLKK
ncbi:hypothetical protein BH10ACI2_BH10ACI2_10300 [soil metagenome]